MYQTLENIINKTIEFKLYTEKEEEELKKSLLEVEANLKQETPYIKFLNAYNKICKTAYKPHLQAKKQFKEVSYQFSVEQILQALKNAQKNKWIQEQKTITTNILWILQEKNINKFLNSDGNSATKNIAKIIKEVITNTDFE